MVFVLFAISIITFLIFNVIPGGDPVLRIAGRNANEADARAGARGLRLQRPDLRPVLRR